MDRRSLGSLEDTKVMCHQTGRGSGRLAAAQPSDNERLQLSTLEVSSSTRRRAAGTFTVDRPMCQWMSHPPAAIWAVLEDALGVSPRTTSLGGSQMWV